MFYLTSIRSLYCIIITRNVFTHRALKIQEFFGLIDLSRLCCHYILTKTGFLATGRERLMLLCIVYAMFFVDTVDTGVCGSYTTLYTEE